MKSIVSDPVWGIFRFSVTEVVYDLHGDFMAYSYELASWNEDGNKLREVITCFLGKLKEADLCVNVDKTKIMIMSLEEEELKVEVEGSKICGKV